MRRLFSPAAEGVNAAEWTPRELRHSFVSLLSDRGVPLEEISRLVGHSADPPRDPDGAVVMDGIFKRDPKP